MLMTATTYVDLALPPKTQQNNSYHQCHFLDKTSEALEIECVICDPVISEGQKQHPFQRPWLRAGAPRSAWCHP